MDGCNDEAGLSGRQKIARTTASMAGRWTDAKKTASRLGDGQFRDKWLRLRRMLVRRAAAESGRQADGSDGF